MVFFFFGMCWIWCLHVIIWFMASLQNGSNFVQLAFGKKIQVFCWISIYFSCFNLPPSTTVTSNHRAVSMPCLVCRGNTPWLDPTNIPDNTGQELFHRCRCSTQVPKDRVSSTVSGESVLYLSPHRQFPEKARVHGILWQPARLTQIRTLVCQNTNYSGFFLHPSPPSPP